MVIISSRLCVPIVMVSQSRRDPFRSLLDESQLILTQCIVEKLTNATIRIDGFRQSRNKLFCINHTVGIVSTTSKGDGHLIIDNIRDRFDGGRSELREHDLELCKGTDGVFRALPFPV